MGKESIAKINDGVVDAFEVSDEVLRERGLCRYIMEANGRRVAIWTDWFGTIVEANNGKLKGQRIYEVSKQVLSKLPDAVITDPFELYALLHADLLSRFGKEVTSHAAFSDWAKVAMRLCNGVSAEEELKEVASRFRASSESSKAGES